MKVFLDDKREAPPEWLLIDNIEDIKLMLLVNEYASLREGVSFITHMSLDHDLGTNQTGYDLICWIEEQIHNGELEILPEFSVHSANSVGRRKMEAGLDKIKQLLKEKNET